MEHRKQVTFSNPNLGSNWKRMTEVLPHLLKAVVCWSTFGWIRNFPVLKKFKPTKKNYCCRNRINPRVKFLKLALIFAVGSFLQNMNKSVVILFLWNNLKNEKLNNTFSVGFWATLLTRISEDFSAIIKRQK